MRRALVCIPSIMILSSAMQKCARDGEPRQDDRRLNSHDRLLCPERRPRRSIGKDFGRMPRRLGLDCVLSRPGHLNRSACRPRLGILSMIFHPNVITHRFIEQATDVIIDLGSSLLSYLGAWRSGQRSPGAHWAW